MMDETLQLLRYACKIELITRREMERMLESLGTPADGKPPTQLLVEQALLSEALLADLWSDTRLSQSLENGVLEPDDVDTLRALREIHANPARQQELLEVPNAHELETWTDVETPEPVAISEAAQKAHPTPSGPGPEADSNDSGMIEFEPDPSLSQYRTQPETQSAPAANEPAPADPVTARLQPDPLTAAHYVPPAKPSKIPLLLLLLIALGLGARVAQLELQQRQPPIVEEEKQPGRTKTSSKAELTGAQRAAIILREAERILPPASNEDPREQLYELTMRWFQRALAEGGETPQTYQRLGLHLIIRWGEYGQALASLTKADEAPRTRWAKAFAYDRLVRLKLRDAVLAQLADSTPGLYQQAAKAEQARVAGRLEAARDAYEKLTGERVRDPFVTLQYVRVLTRIGRSATAARQLELLHSSYPHFLAARIEAAHALARQGQALQALKQLKLLASKAPNDPACQLALGVALRKQGSHGESVETLELLLDETPEHAIGQLELARSLMAHGKRPAAKEAAARAVKLDASLTAAVKKLLGN